MVKLVCLSDTHGRHAEVNIPECDILLFAGDFSSSGRPHEVTSFLDWFSVQPAKHLCYIAGNHDLSYQNNPQFKLNMINAYPSLHYLESSGVVLCGLNIWGSPYSPVFGNWAFMLREKPIQEEWAKIPNNTDVLITHGPPLGILDTVSFTGDMAGCKSLAKRIDQLGSIKVSVFGHIHQQEQQTRMISGVTFVNAAICDDDYYATSKPVTVNL